MKYFFRHFNLINKLSLAILLSVIVSISLLGIYFDTFLEDTYFKSTKKRINHGFERIFSDIQKIDYALKKGIMFIQSDENILASIDLVNNYQDKQNYNAILLDEEKKSIVKQLLDRVKLSLNNEIVLYDKNGELIAFVVKEENGYYLCFIAYENGEVVRYIKHESELEYKKCEKARYENINFNHQSYYEDSEIINKSIITYHNLNDEIFIKSHQNIYDNNKKLTAHIEMSYTVGKTYLASLSNDLDINIIMSHNQEYAQNSAHLLNKNEIENMTIAQTQNSYFGVATIRTQNSDIYFVASLDKATLTKTLYESRTKLLLILGVTILFTWLLFRLLFTKILAEPIKKLMLQISKVEQGDYSKSELIFTGDELQCISKNINQLASAVQERENDLQSSREHLEYISYHDALTDLPNRRLFNIKLSHALELAKRNRSKVAVLFLDLDQFKQVNDTLGHNIGDELLKAVSQRLSQTLRSSDTLARIGGDEFNILVENIEYIKEIEFIVQKLINDFAKHFTFGEYEISTTVSIGIAIYPDDGQDSNSLIKNADLAMYKAKDMGRNNYSFFSNSLSEYIEDRIKRINALKYAISVEDEFFLVYQPKVSTKTKKIVAVEALIRWNSSVLGFVAPDQFISIAEDTGLIIPIGDWVLKQACSDFVLLQKEGCLLEQISINMSGIQLQKSDMLKTLNKIIYETGIKANQIELEITESYIATNGQSALNTLIEFRKIGVDLAIDDFGTGYSSMSYLQKLPVTRLKIDKSFIDDLPYSGESVAVAKAIIALAKTFNLSITAEGVENEAQLNFLDEQGCDEIQGYYYSKPLKLDDLKEFCRLS
ncbi:MAG: EAL domain-containing protein [Sulfurimonas sp.]|jgi:diguanylate cyclase (GGDEF)-like protein